MKLHGTWIIAFLALACGISLAQPVESFHVGAPTVVFSTQDMQALGIDFPDLPIGVVREGRRYSIFGSGGSFGGIGPGPREVPPGTYRFTGSLERFEPAQRKGRYPAYSLALGRLQPSPDRSDFDRDYAGGGATYPLRSEGKRFLAHLYHGEYWPDAPNGARFYSCEGMAISTDGGASFSKLGEVLSPHVTRGEFFDRFGPGAKAGLAADGDLIEADEHGAPLTPGADAYWYALFTDQETVKGPRGFAIARIKKSEMLSALARHETPRFTKYYEPRGFVEPGVGGSSTLILPQPKDFIAQPQVHYCSYLHKFVLVYQTNQNQVQIRTSPNLMRWDSPPITLVDSRNTPDLKTFYPSAIGLEADPWILGQRFYLYYQQRRPSRPHNPVYYRALVTIKR